MKCNSCGSDEHLFPDHGGYYHDAVDDEGRPYLCRLCRDPAYKKRHEEKEA